MDTRNDRLQSRPAETVVEAPHADPIAQDIVAQSEPAAEPPEADIVEARSPAEQQGTNPPIRVAQAAPSPPRGTPSAAQDADVNRPSPFTTDAIQTALSGLHRGSVWQNGRFEFPEDVYRAVSPDEVPDGRSRPEKRLRMFETVVNRSRAELTEALAEAEPPRGLPMTEQDLGWLSENRSDLLELVTNRATHLGAYRRYSGERRPEDDSMRIRPSSISYRADTAVEDFYGPVELAVRGRGDCEDGCMTALLALEAIGFPPASMGMSVVIHEDETEATAAHVVALIYTGNDEPPLVLDPLPTESYTRSGSRITQGGRPRPVERADESPYEPYAIMNRDGFWDIDESDEKWTRVPAPGGADSRSFRFEGTRRSLSNIDAAFRVVMDRYAMIGPPPAALASE
ncbi:MAG: hypothetical protein AAFZ38_11025 [Myxococcota bacterium]